MCSHLQLQRDRMAPRPAENAHTFKDLRNRRVLDWNLLCSCSAGKFEARAGTRRMKLIVGTSWGRKSRVSMLPLLVVLFVISYGMLTTLVVLQDRTIDSQRSLIHVLFQDSLHLSALNKHAKPAGASAAPSQPARSGTAQASAAQSQVPEKEASEKQVPSTSARQPANGKGKSSRRAQKPQPERPPADVTDPSDMRRVTFSI